MKKMSKAQQLVELLINSNLSDNELSKNLRVSKKHTQLLVHQINFNKRKFKQFVIIRKGKYGNYIRELTTKNSNENNILDGGRKRGMKGLKQFDGRRKLLAIAMNTRQGQKNRMVFIHNVLKQNLELSIEAQKLLQ